MAQFSAAITACNSESHFAKAYSDGVMKNLFWEYVFEDAMDLIAKLPTIAAIIYRNLYRDGTSVGAIDDAKVRWPAMSYVLILGIIMLVAIRLYALAAHFSAPD